MLYLASYQLPLFSLAANRQTGSNYSTNQESVKTVADSFNGRLLFDPRVLQMVYSVRDPVVYGIFQVRKPRGFARKWVENSFVLCPMWSTLPVCDNLFQQREKQTALSPAKPRFSINRLQGCYKMGQKLILIWFALQYCRSLLHFTYRYMFTYTVSVVMLLSKYKSLESHIKVSSL